MMSPTAQQSDEEAQLTPRKKSPCGGAAGLGVGSTCHPRPVKRAEYVFGASRPTARQYARLMQSMEYSEAPGVVGAEKFTKELPVHRSMSGFVVPEVERLEPGASNPTARQNVEAHEMPANRLWPPAGVATGTPSIVIEAAALGFGLRGCLVVVVPLPVVPPPETG